MIGIFDSGTGGLSIYLEIKKLMPEVNCAYFADHAHFPYGEKTAKQIMEYSCKISSYLASIHVSMIVVACNTATIAAIKTLRSCYSFPFVGTVPAVKPACSNSKSRKVAVLLTQSASQGHVFRDLLSSWSNGVEVYTLRSPELVEISEYQLQEKQCSVAYLKSLLDPLIAKGVDSLVLGSTHFIFLKSWIAKIYPAQFAIYDPAEGVARQTLRLYSQCGKSEACASDIFITSGDLAAFHAKLKVLLTPYPQTSKIMQVSL